MAVAVTVPVFVFMLRLAVIRVTQRFSHKRRFRWEKRCVTTPITAAQATSLHVARYYANTSLKTKKMERCLRNPSLHLNTLRSNARPRKRKDLDNFSCLRLYLPYCYLYSGLYERREQEIGKKKERFPFLVLAFVLDFVPASHKSACLR